MKYLLTIVVAAILATVASPALAHRPYYTQIEKIRLPNGELGEVRLLKGDGVFFTDPVRPIVIDEQGHLIARGPKALSMSVLCGEDHRCVIVNLWDAHLSWILRPSDKEPFNRPHKEEIELMIGSWKGVTRVGDSQRAKLHRRRCGQPTWCSRAKRSTA